MPGGDVQAFNVQVVPGAALACIFTGGSSEPMVPALGTSCGMWVIGHDSHPQGDGKDAAAFAGPRSGPKPFQMEIRTVGRDRMWSLSEEARSIHHRSLIRNSSSSARSA